MSGASDDGGQFRARYAAPTEGTPEVVPSEALPPPYHPDVRQPVPAAAVAALVCGACGLVAGVLPALVAPALLVSVLGVGLSLRALRRGQALALSAAVVSGAALLVGAGCAVVVLSAVLLS